MCVKEYSFQMCLFVFITVFIMHGGLYRVSRPVVFVVSPNMLKLNTNETVTLATFGNADGVHMNIYLQDYPQLSKNYSFKEVFVPRDEVVNITICLSSDDVTTLPKNSQYVYLVVDAKTPKNPFHHMAKLLIDYQPGYIFIQTDKPVYTPGQEVKIRIIPIDEELRLVDEEVRVDIVNPDNVTVSRSRKRSNGSFIEERLGIPDYPVYGNYTVTASFVQFQTASSVRFEIMKYVLPKFKAYFEIEEGYKVILPDQSSFKAKIKARYVFGKPVKGHATFLYGLVWHGHIFNLGKQRNLKFSVEGEIDITINISKLRAASESMWFPNDGRLLMKAVVTEEASGKMEYSISQDVVFARSLYVFKFERCSKYFKPGLPYLVDVDVIKANGDRAKYVPVIIEGSGHVKEKLIKLVPVENPSKQLETNFRGSVTTEFILPTEIKTLTINVRTNFSGQVDTKQVKSIFIAVPYFSPSNTYLSVRAHATKSDKIKDVPAVGEFMTVKSTYSSATFLNTINLLVISKGKIIDQSRTKTLSDHRTELFIPVTSEMTPSVRVLAFSIRGSVAGSEVVADSVWINIQKCCEKEISILFGNGEDIYKPSVDTKLKLTGSPNSTVALLAVDEGVYIMKKNTLTRDMFFESIESHDRGCGYGGGENSGNVFERAGLVVLTNANMKTKERSPVGCADERSRQKRSAVLWKQMCCKKGYEQLNPDQENCLYIATFLKNETNSICAKEFYHCCRYASHGLESSRARLYRPRNSDYDEDDVILGKILLRSNFPESWLFKEIRLGKTGETEIDVRLPDLITTWTVNALSASNEYGFCISTPKKLTVFKSFFVELDLPYSAVRLEQLEVRATVFNYLKKHLSVKLFMQSVDGICYSGESGENSEMSNVDIPPNDAISVAFPVIPLELGLFPIRVYVYSLEERDAVEKLLYVEGEGVEKIHTVSVMLDPSGKRLSRDEFTNVTVDVKNEVDQVGSRQRVHLDLDLPINVVPHTEKCTVSAIGDILGPTVSGIINGITYLLKLPTGCGEQNLIHLAPNVYVLKYLRATRRLLSDVEKKARAFIKQGLTKQFTFRKTDGSFATWPHTESSTWLTAFTLKVLTQARSFVSIDENVTCRALKWLLNRQRLDGSFKEEYWIVHKEMMGGTSGETTLTAFVIIAILESDCKPQNGQYKLKSITYIENNLEHLDRPLAVAMAAYALALSNSPLKYKANEMLQNFAEKSKEGFIFWGSGERQYSSISSDSQWLKRVPNAIAVEATGYALLTQLEMGEMEYSNKIVGWILQQRESHGSFVSTQDTVIGLQALAEYSIRTYSSILDMTCQITSEADKSFQKHISLTHEDALVLKSVQKVPIGGMLMFEAAGTGVGLMQVEVRYNIPKEESSCMFDITVDSKYLSNMILQFFDQNNRPSCELCSKPCGEQTIEDEDDFDAFTFPSVIPRIQNPRFLEDKTNINPGPRVGRPLFSLNSSHKTRNKRSISSRVLCLEVCVRFKGDSETGMAIIDVGLFTGYHPIDGDLDIMKDRGKIDHYENSKRSVLLYVSEISHKKTECFKFRSKQKHVVENIQPAIIRVYDYYDPGVRCTSFYKMNNVSGNLANFCDNQKRICKCLEGRCSPCEDFWHGRRWTHLIKYACHNSTYVFVIKVLDKQSESAGFERVLAIVKHLLYSDGDFEVIKNSKLILLKRSSCSCPSFEIDNSYYLMTSNPKRFKDNKNNIVYTFLMDKLVGVAKVYKGKTREMDREKRFMKRQFRKFQKRLIRKGCNRQEG